MAPLPFYGWRAPLPLGQWNTSPVRAPGGPGGSRRGQRNGIRAVVVCVCAEGERQFVPINVGLRRVKWAVRVADGRTFLHFYFVFTALVQVVNCPVHKIMNPITIAADKRQQGSGKLLKTMLHINKNAIWCMIFNNFIGPCWRFRTHWWCCSCQTSNWSNLGSVSCLRTCSIFPASGIQLSFLSSCSFLL